MTRTYLLGGAMLALLGAGYLLMRPVPALDTGQDAAQSGAPLVAVTVPQLDDTATIGAAIFAKTCAACHGDSAAGKEGFGPPLVHKIYEPSHHGDEAFQRGVANGVQSHHWPFGDMPPQEGLTRGDVAMVVAYVRALQRANGIQ